MAAWNYDWIKLLSHWLCFCVLYQRIRIGSSQTIGLNPNGSVTAKIPKQEEVHLSCTASSDFVPGRFRQLIWKKGDINLSINDEKTPNAPSRINITVTGTTYTLVISSPECSDEANYTCGIPAAPTAPSETVEVQIGSFDVTKTGCDNSTGLKCWANETYPEPRLELHWSSTIYDKYETTEGKDRTQCNKISKDSTIVANETRQGTYPAIFYVYFDDDTTPFHKIETSFEGPKPPSPGLSTGAIVGIVIGSIVGLVLIIVLIIYLVKEYCPCSCCPSSNGNVPDEFEIDGVKEDKTIEISPGKPIRLAATCYGAKPPASIQWCISYNGKDPVDMTEKDYGNSDALNTSVTTNKRDPKTSDTHSKLEMVPNEDHDGAVIHCVAITKISADEEKWDLKTSPKITLKLKKGQVGDYPGQGGYYQGQGGDYRHQGGDYRGQDGYHQGQGGDNHGQGGNYHRHVGQAGQEYQPHGNTRNDKDPFPQPGKRPNALEPIQGQRTLTPIGDIEKTSFKKKRQTNKQTSEL